MSPCPVSPPPPPHLQKYPIVWQGLLALKNDTAAVQLHFVSGNNVLAHRSLPAPEGGPPLRIAQRMRLEMSQLEGVARRMLVSAGTGLSSAGRAGRSQQGRAWKPHSKSRLRGPGHLLRLGGGGASPLCLARPPPPGFFPQPLLSTQEAPQRAPELTSCSCDASGGLAKRKRLRGGAELFPTGLPGGFL